MEEPPSEQSVPVRYEQVNDAPRMPVSGVYGGIENDGMITAAFYHEHSIPDSQTLRVTDSEELMEEGTSEPRLTRTVQAVAHLSPQQAISIGKWLIEKGILSMNEAPQPDLEELMDQIGFEIATSESE